MRFQCLTCPKTVDAHIKLKEAGTRVVIGDHEQGDIETVKQEIGDDLTEAVYFRFQFNVGLAVSIVPKVKPISLCQILANPDYSPAVCF